jgi:hypothetical protein
MLLDSGLWGKFDALYVPAMHTAQAAALNWIGDTYNLVTGETFVPGRGFVGSGSASTGFNPATAVGAHYTQNSAAIGFWCLTDQPDNSDRDMLGNGNALLRAYRNGGQIAARLNTPTTALIDYSGLNKTAVGLTWASRLNSAGYRVGRNADVLGDVVEASEAPSNTVIEVGGGTVSADTNAMLAFAFIGAGLTDAEAAMLYRIVSPLLADHLAPVVWTLDTATTHQAVEGIGFELQSDHIRGDAGGIEEADTEGIPRDLTTEERARLASEFGAGFTDYRLAMGLYYRGVTPDGRNFVERLEGQNAAMADFTAAAGVGINFMYWSPAPYWKRKVISGVTYRGSEAVPPAKGTPEWNTYLRYWLQGGGLDHPVKADDPSGYAAWMEAFSDSVITDMEYVHANIGPIVKFSPQNEPHAGGGGYGSAVYPQCRWEDEEMYDFLKVMVPKIRANAALSTYDGEPNFIKIYVDEMEGQTGVGADLIKADAALLAELAGWTWHPLSGTPSNAAWVHQNRVGLNTGTAGKPVGQTEFEYFTSHLDQTLRSYLTRDYRFVNTFLLPMYWFVYVNSPFFYWIHIGKPTTGPAQETEGRALTVWRPPGAATIPEYPDLAEGHFEPVKVNWHAIKPWVKLMPRGAVRVEMAAPYLQYGCQAMAWLTPAGKLVVAVGNREAEPYSMTLDTGADVVCAGWLYDQHNADVSLGTKRLRAGTVITVPPFSAVIWSEV